MRTNYTESNIEENIDMRNKFRFKKLPSPQENSEAVCKSYVDSGLNDPSIIRNTTHVDFKDKKLDKFRFIKVNSMPAIGEHLTAKYYVDRAIHEPTLVRNNQDNNFNNHN